MLVCYRTSIANNFQTDNSQNNILNKFPLFHPNIENRIKVMNDKSKMSMIESYDPENIENFRPRDYIKFEVIFKLFMFFILFGAHIKGYNIPFFLSLLILYYWYSLYTDIAAFYDKKLSEFKMTVQELKDLNLLNSYDPDDQQMLENAEDNDIAELQKKLNLIESGNYRINNNIVINPVTNPENTESKVENANADSNEDVKRHTPNLGIIDPSINSPNQNNHYKIDNINTFEDIIIENLENKEDNQNIINEIKTENKEITIKLADENKFSKIFDNEPEDISHLLNKLENKKAKELAKKQNEGIIR